jgi:neurotransmitter:Na+ symporter, NSS family
MSVPCPGVADPALRSRGHWSGRWGFVLAASGSAVGLGNIWKFPYVAGQNGGAAFLIAYVAIVFTLGVSVMLAEFVIGRAAQRNPVGAFAALKGGGWVWIGYMGVVAGFVILSFYSVVAGWTIAYVVKSATGLLHAADPKALGAIFGDFVAHPGEPLIYHFAFMAMTVGVAIAGVHGGIEQSCKILLPLLFLIMVVLAVRAITLPGAMEGLRFYLHPDLTKVNGAMLGDALAQAFFSLSLGMGAMLTYGSYLSRELDLPRAALWVTLCDTMVALTAGLVVLPAVFAFHYDPAAGPGLVFITLPAVFAHMPLGIVFAIAFFVLLLIAALTSSVSLLEVVVAYAVDELGMRRATAALLAGAACFVCGIPALLSLGPWKDVTIAGKTILDAMDFAASNVMLPLGGIAMSLFVGWAILPRAMNEATAGGQHGFAWAGLWRVVCRYVAPAAIAWILIAGL